MSPRLSRLSRETLKECLVSQLRNMQLVWPHISLFGHVRDGLDVRFPSICYESSCEACPGKVSQSGGVGGFSSSGLCLD